MIIRSHVVVRTKWNTNTTTCCFLLVTYAFTKDSSQHTNYRLLKRAKTTSNPTSPYKSLELHTSSEYLLPSRFGTSDANTMSSSISWCETWDVGQMWLRHQLQDVSCPCLDWIWLVCPVKLCLHNNPYAPCMVSIPTFRWFLGQMLVNKVNK